jgi:hypothetical protein
MSPEQLKLYWANLNAVFKALPSPGGEGEGEREPSRSADINSFRAAFHQQHNLPASTKDFTKAHMDEFLRACAAITKPDDLGPQLRAFDQPKIRLLHKILNWLGPQLAALGIADANAYIRKIAEDKFGKLPADLSDMPRSSHGSRYSQLDVLHFTIQNRVKDLRQKRGWTVHELLWQFRPRQNLRNAPTALKWEGEAARRAN